MLTLLLALSAPLVQDWTPPPPPPTVPGVAMAQPRFSPFVIPDELRVVTQVAADADRLLGAKGAQAYCLACPSPQAAQSQASAPDGWLARIAALLFG